MNYKKIVILIIILFSYNNISNSKQILIVAKIGDEIITNIDVEIEKEYLLLLNNSLNKLSKEDIFNLAKKSLIREKIKNKEISKLFNNSIDSKLKKQVLENFYKKLRLGNKDELIKILDEKNLSLGNLTEKLLLEAKWNRLIYIKFSNKVKVDKAEMKKQIKNIYNKQKKNYEYNLSEILIDTEKYNSLKKGDIKNYINNFGFKIAANKYSKSDTSKYGGEIGWVKDARLSKKIKDKISQIKIGEITEPIQSPNGFLILKLNDKKEITKKLNLEKELKQQIAYEKNRQLNQYSLNYYKKLKQNIIIYENK